MKNYAPENASFLLPFKFDPEQLVADLNNCRQYQFLSNYVPANYDGDNYILPLRSVDGRINFPAAAPNDAERYKDTEVLASCPYFQSVISTFKCEKEAIRLMNLPSGKIVNTHTDFACGYEDGIFRIHIPIITNDKVVFILNDVNLRMQAGEAWYTNVNLPHGVKNEGDTDRVNLVIDCIRNDWSDKLFAQLGYNFSLENNVDEELSEEVVVRMIEELQHQNTEASRALIADLKSKLDHHSDITANSDDNVPSSPLL